MEVERVGCGCFTLSLFQLAPCYTFHKHEIGNVNIVFVQCTYNAKLSMYEAVKAYLPFWYIMHRCTLSWDMHFASWISLLPLVKLARVKGYLLLLVLVLDRPFVFSTWSCVHWTLWKMIWRSQWPRRQPCWRSFTHTSTTHNGRSWTVLKRTKLYWKSSMWWVDEGDKERLFLNKMFDAGIQKSEMIEDTIGTIEVFVITLSDISTSEIKFKS